LPQEGGGLLRVEEIASSRFAAFSEGNGTRNDRALPRHCEPPPFEKLEAAAKQSPQAGFLSLTTAPMPSAAVAKIAETK